MKTKQESFVDISIYRQYLFIYISICFGCLLYLLFFFLLNVQVFLSYIVL